MEPKEAILENLVQELKRGTQVLAVLLCMDRPVYGYSLVASLQEQGVDIEQNTLYPLLRRLEKQGLLQSSWETGESRPRKYYKISPLGAEIRSRLLNEWNAINQAIHGMTQNPTEETR